MSAADIALASLVGPLHGDYTLPTDHGGVSVSLPRLHGVDRILVDQWLAKAWLDFNVHNRSLNMAAVNRMAADMKHGRWLDNGETIKFDREGRLIDGQHRLSAIWVSGVPIELLVVSGLEPSAQATVDIGTTRTTGAILKLHGTGVANGKEKAALAHALIRHERVPHQKWASNNAASKTELVQFVLANDERLSYAHSQGMAAYHAIGSPRTPYALLAFHVTSADWSQFHDAIIHGANLSPGDPRLALRNLMLRRDRSAAGDWGQQQGVGVVIKAWNAWRRGKQIKTLMYRAQELPLAAIEN